MGDSGPEQDATRQAALGAALGVALMILCWVLALISDGGPWTPAGILQIHLSNPVIWVGDFAPLALAIIGWRFGELTVQASQPMAIRATQADAVDSDSLHIRVANAIVQMSMDGILVMDGETRILSINPTVQRIFGYAEDELVGHGIDILIPKHGDQEGSVSTYRRTGHDDVLGIEWRMEGRHKDGKLFPIELTDTFIGMDGDQVHVYQIRDISERLQSEDKMRKVNQVLSELRDQALLASRAKSAFLANMSHELRTPLNAILGYSEMLKEEMEDIGHEDLIPDLEKIHAAGRHLLALINSILDLSKIEAGRMELYMETTDVRRTVADVEELARPLAAKKDNRLIVECTEDVGTMVTDQTKLRQVLLNLLSNACKFTESGTVTLKVSRYQPVDADWISFTISDTGIGMSEVQMSKLFQEFIQADASTTRKFGGTGLGLAISRRFCHMMGGDINVKSQVAAGSTFTVRLPANTTRPSTSDEEQALQITRSDATSRVLVIDDDPGVRELLARMLAKEGFNVATASSGEQGVQRALEFDPAVITLDVMMPGMDGWSVLAAMKNDPKIAHIPVVMVSMLDERRVGYALGAAAYMTKPIDRKRLVKTLGRFQDEPPFHVLLVEDEPDVREIVRRTLEGDGWAVSEAQNGHEALEALSKPPAPTAILLDLMMPEMDGFQFVAEIDRHEEWRDIPVVVITAMDLTNEQREQLGGRVERILQKGAYTRDELIDIVRDKVNQHALRAAKAMLSGSSENEGESA